MTAEEMEAEIKSLRQQQEARNKRWACWGLAAYLIAIVLVLAVLLRVAFTGANPAPPMIFIVLTFLFLGLAFTSAEGRRPFPWSRR